MDWYKMVDERYERKWGHTIPQLIFSILWLIAAFFVVAANKTELLVLLMTISLQLVVMLVGLWVLKLKGRTLWWTLLSPILAPVWLQEIDKRPIEQRINVENAIKWIKDTMGQEYYGNLHNKVGASGIVKIVTALCSMQNKFYSNDQIAEEIDRIIPTI